jgi:hypothetical protein
VSSSDSPGSSADLTSTDDVAAPSLTAPGLQGHMSLVIKWMKQSRCRLDVDKSKSVMLSPDKALRDPSFALGAPNVECVFRTRGLLLRTFRTSGPSSQTNQGDTLTKYVLQRVNRAFGARYPVLRCNESGAPVRLMMVFMFLFPLLQHTVPPLGKPLEWSKGKNMDVVACNAPLCNVFKLYPKGVTREIVFGDASAIVSNTASEPCVAEMNESRNSRGTLDFGLEQCWFSSSHMISTTLTVWVCVLHECNASTFSQMRVKCLIR